MQYNFPATYQPYYQQQNNGIIWVQGEAGAKSYLVAPNSTVQLWDSEAQTIYLKSADASGMVPERDITIEIFSTRNDIDRMQLAGDLLDLLLGPAPSDQK